MLFIRRLLPDSRCLLVVVHLMVSTGNAYALDNPCDANYVVLAGAEFQMDPTGIDDTQNLQCALDSAKQQAINKIQLNRGEFFVRDIAIEDFYGVLSGQSKANTKITLLGDIDCKVAADEGRSPASFKFSKGAPRLQNMTISGSPYCATSEDLTPDLISFSGKPATDSTCENDVIFAVVDRVAIVGDGRSGGVAISAAPEGPVTRDCDRKLLGTLKVNRSEISSYSTAIYTQMKAGAQVDINFNVFERNFTDVWIFDANQLTYVIENTFDHSNLRSNDVEFGVWALSSDLAPADSKLFISGNQFQLDTYSEDGLVFGIFLDNREKQTNSKPTIIDNTFTFTAKPSDEGRTFGVLEHGFAGGLIASNIMRGAAEIGIFLGAYDEQAVTESSNWVVKDNRVANLDSDVPIFLYRVSDAVVSTFSSDEVAVSDYGINNSTIVSGGSGSSGGGSGSSDGGGSGSGNSGSNVACVTAPAAFYGTTAQEITMRNGAVLNNYDGRSWYTSESHTLFKSDAGRWYTHEAGLINETYRIDLLTESSTCFEPDLFTISSRTNPAIGPSTLYWSGGSVNVGQNCSIGVGAVVFFPPSADKDVVVDVRLATECPLF